MSFIPLLGLGFGALALYHFCRVYFQGKADWNPARVYLYWGMVLAILGLLGHALAATIILYRLLNP